MNEKHVRIRVPVSHARERQRCAGDHLSGRQIYVVDPPRISRMVIEVDLAGSSLVAAVVWVVAAAAGVTCCHWRLKRYGVCQGCCGHAKKCYGDEEHQKLF